MKNQLLKREIDNNTQNNEVFTRQSAKDLEKTAQYIKENCPQDLCIHFSNFMWGNLNQLLTIYPNHQLMIWKEYVASKVLEQMEVQYKQQEESFVLGDEPLEDLQRLLILSHEEQTFQLLKLNPMGTKRIHFVMNGINDEVLCQAIGSYLSDDIPQIAMIYTNSDVYLENQSDENACWNQYDYVAFDGMKDGVSSNGKHSKEKIKKPL